MDAPSSQMVVGVAVAFAMILLALLGFVLSERAARNRRMKLVSAKVSHETVFVQENRAPDVRLYVPGLFIPSMGINPAVGFIDESVGRYHNVVITPEYPQRAIVFDSKTRAQPGSYLRVVVMRDPETNEVIQINPDLTSVDESSLV